jgi:hypothetical protein
VLEAVHQTTRDQSKADLFKGFRRSTQLRDKVTALPTFRQHGFNATYLTLNSAKSFPKILHYVVWQFH